MLKRFLKFAFILIVSGLIGIGCSSSSDDPAPTNGDGNGDDTPTGTTYTMTSYFPLSSSWETDQRTFFVDCREREINGISTKAMVDTELPRVRYWTNDNNGLRLHAIMDEDGIIPFEQPIVLLSNEIEVGDKNEGSFSIYNEELNFIVELLGTEDVTVPAGTFTECLKFKLDVYAVGESADEKGYETVWLAKDVGFVKSTADSDYYYVLFTDRGETRQLLSYSISSNLSADQEGIKSLMANYSLYFEAMNLNELMNLYSENYKNHCFDKQSKKDWYEDIFNDNDEHSLFCSVENITIQNNEASADIEWYVTGLPAGDTERWYRHIKDSGQFIKENDVWLRYGSQMDITPYPEGAGGTVFPRNAIDGPLVVVSAALYDCNTDSSIDTTDNISTFTITGPVGSGLNNGNLLNSWLEDFDEFWAQDLISFDNVKSGFYTFRIEDNAGNFFRFSDYLEVNALLELPVPITPTVESVVNPTDIYFSWSSVMGIDYYRLEIEEDVGEDDWQRAENIVTENTNFTKSLDPGKSYRYRIKARQRDRLNGDFTENSSRCSWVYFDTQ